MFIGVGASRVRDLFNKAQMNSPCLVFIDEIDAVGMQRGTGIGGGKDEREQTLNQVWTEMDGFSGNSGVIVIAAVDVKLEGLPAEGVGRCKLSSSGRENPCTRSHGEKISPTPENPATAQNRSLPSRSPQRTVWLQQELNVHVYHCMHIPDCFKDTAFIIRRIGCYRYCM
ncbi:unnamed protein product [Camellia sinensis]